MATAWIGIVIAFGVIVVVTVACLIVAAIGRGLAALRRWLQWRHVRRQQRERRADLREALRDRRRL